MSTDVMFGNPTGDFIAKLSQSIRAGMGTASNPDYRFSITDYNNAIRLLPFNNMLVIQNFLNAIGNRMELPRRSLEPEVD